VQMRAVCCPPSVACCRLSAACCLLSPVYRLPSTPLSPALPCITQTPSWRVMRAWVSKGLGNQHDPRLPHNHRRRKKSPSEGGRHLRYFNLKCVRLSTYTSVCGLTNAPARFFFVTTVEQQCDYSVTV
jgi:hypothetical protein